MSRHYKIVILSCLLCQAVNLHAADNGETFLNVKQWKGYLDIRVTETLSTQRQWQAGHEKRELTSQRNFRIRLHTDNGMATAVDPFISEQAPDSIPPGKDKRFAGKDMRKMQQAMQGSGINPAMMRQIMGEMNRMQGLDIAQNKYKQWSETSFRSNTSGNWKLTDITRGKAIDASGKPCSYNRTRKVDARYIGTGGLVLVVNLQKHAYSFKWNITSKAPQRANEQRVDEDSCEGNNKLAREIAFARLKGKEMKPILFEPLPEIGLMLRGAKRFRETRDDGKAYVMHLKWVFVPSDQTLPNT